MVTEVEYLHLLPNDLLPDISHWQPFRVALLVEAPVQDDWKIRVSQWLVQSGCLYVSAWGIDCSSWDDSVDFALLEKFDYGEIPDADFVMTTWHDGETLAKLFFFVKNNAWHAEVSIQKTAIIHIATQPKRTEFVAAYENA